MNDPQIKNERTAANLVAVLVATGLPTLVTLIYFVALSDSSPAVQQSAYVIGKSIQFLLPVVWVWLFFRYRFFASRRQTPKKTDSPPAALEKIPNWLWAVGFGIDVCIIMGIAWWFLSGSHLLENLTSEVQSKVSGLGIGSVWKFAILGFFYAIVHSFLEEYYWRWFVYDILKRFLHVAAANLISSLGFMAHHVVLLSVYFGINSPMTWICSAGVAIGGIFWAWLYEKTGTILWPWLSHMVVDAGIFVLGYFLVFR